MTDVGVGAEILHQRRQSDVDGSLVRIFTSVPHPDKQAKFTILANPENILPSLIPSHRHITLYEAQRNELQ